MTIKIQQNNIKILSVDRKVLEEFTTEIYVVTPDTGKILYNKETGKKYEATITVATKLDLAKIVELDKE